MGIKANLCDDCSSRGLCVGEVELDVVPVVIPLKHSATTDVEGLEITATDSDGVLNVIDRIVPATYTTATQGDRSWKVATNISIHEALTSDRVLAAFNADPDAMLRAIVARVGKCKKPELREVLDDHTGFTHLRSCRATARVVLNTLATRIVPLL